jgi:Family of unknown function (DUF6494)
VNPDHLNMEIRKFLKAVGVTSQREIEAAVQQALAAGRLQGKEKLDAKAVLTIPRIGFSHEVAGTIEVE